MTITDQRWLTQLMSIPAGSRFFLSALPYYNMVKDNPRELVHFQNEFDKWIKATDERYVSRGTSDYLKMRRHDDA